MTHPMRDPQVSGSDPAAVPDPEPAAAGAPPRRPPTAVGAADGPGGGGGDGPLPVDLVEPLMDTDLDPVIARRLERAGVITIADLAASSIRIDAVDLTSTQRRALRVWLARRFRALTG